MQRLWMVCVVLLIATVPAWGQERPTAEETRKVIDYYYGGKGQGAVAMEFYLCAAVAQEEGPDKNECLEKANPGRIEKGQELWLWMNYLVPLDDTADILLAFSRKAKVRRTTRVVLKGATRFRTWKRIPTNKVGQWTASLTQELEDQDLELGSMQYEVVEATQ